MNSKRLVTTLLIATISGAGLSGCSAGSQAAPPAVPASVSVTTGPSASAPSAAGAASASATASPSKALTRQQLLNRPIPPRPAKPVMPKIARTNTTQGAEAFVKHYAATLDYAYRVGDWRALEGLGGTACDWCKERQADARARSAAGDKVLDPIHLITVSHSARFDSEGVLVYVMHQLTKNSRYTEKRVLKLQNDKAYRATFALNWKSGSWSITDTGQRWQKLSEVKVNHND